MAKSYYLQTQSTDPAYNLAYEEYVLKNCRQGDWLILWQNRNAVIIGRNQNALEEINRDFVEAHGIKVIRRNTGGGAVYHDMGNLNYSFITDDDPLSPSAARFTQPVVDALKDLGLEAEASGRNDILVSGCKISGTAQHRSNGRILHHGTLLFDSNADMIAGSLNPDPTKFQSKSVKSVRSRVGNIRSFLQKDMTLTQFWEHLETSLIRGGITPTALPQSAMQEILALKAEKYDTWQWNFGSSPKFDSCVRRRWSGGLLEIRFAVAQGSIRSIAVYGDFLALTSLDGLTQALTGCRYNADAIGAVLDDFDLRACLGGITKEEFLSTILNL